MLTSRDWTFDSLLSKHSKLQPIKRISAVEQSLNNITREVQLAEKDGLPLVIGDFHKLPGWNSAVLDCGWLEKHHGDTKMQVRNMMNRRDETTELSLYLKYAAVVEPFTTPNEPARFYGKDGPCPLEWTQWLSAGVLPAYILPHGPGDLFRFMEGSERPETLMTYFGVGDTLTPFHKDLCASIGQNLMTCAAPNSSAFWFLTPSNSSLAISRYFHTKLKSELDWESAILGPGDLSDFPCAVYLCEQKVGDLVIIPRKSCHQVINYGGLTVKASWSRMIPRSLSDSLQEECLIYRRVCRPEVYRTKLLLYRILQKVPTMVGTHDEKNKPPQETVDLTFTLTTLTWLFDELLLSEWHAQPLTESAFREHLTCDFCNADIFSAFFQCDKGCMTTTQEDVQPHFICPTCYIEGRLCGADAVMTPYRHSRCPMESLFEVRNTAAAAINNSVGKILVKILNESYFAASKPSSRILNAGMALRERRVKDIFLKRCSINKTSASNDNSHDISAFAWFNCAKCHRGQCLKHGIQHWKVYSTQMITASKEGNCEAFHAEHQQQGKLISETYGKAMMNPGTPARSFSLVSEPAVEIRLAIAAILFPHCLVNKELMPGAQLGWYDQLDVSAPNVAESRSTPSSTNKAKSKKSKEERKAASAVSNVSETANLVVPKAEPMSDDYVLSTASSSKRRPHQDPPNGETPVSKKPRQSAERERVGVEGVETPTSSQFHREMPETNNLTREDRQQPKVSHTKRMSHKNGPPLTPQTRNVNGSKRQRKDKGKSRASGVLPMDIDRESSPEDPFDLLSTPPTAPLDTLFYPPSSPNIPLSGLPISTAGPSRSNGADSSIEDTMNALVKLNEDLINAINLEREQPTPERQLHTKNSHLKLLEYLGLPDTLLRNRLLTYYPQPNRPEQPERLKVSNCVDHQGPEILYPSKRS